MILIYYLLVIYHYPPRSRTPESRIILGKIDPMSGVFWGSLYYPDDYLYSLRSLIRISIGNELTEKTKRVGGSTVRIMKTVNIRPRLGGMKKKYKEKGKKKKKKT